MRRSFEFTCSSELARPAAEIWQAVGTMQGVNYELGPYLRMSVPAEFRGMHIDQWAAREAPPGAPLFRSLVLLLGILPIDLHSFGMDGVQPGRSFAERSHSLVQREWRHLRSVDALPGGGCRVSDTVIATPRLSLMAILMAPIYRRIFAHRHRRLRRKFG
jgi:hypothetical protein